MKFIFCVLPLLLITITASAIQIPDRSVSEKASVSELDSKHAILLTEQLGQLDMHLETSASGPICYFLAPGVDLKLGRVIRIQKVQASDKDFTIHFERQEDGSPDQHPQITCVESARLKVKKLEKAFQDNLKVIQISQ